MNRFRQRRSATGDRKAASLLAQGEPMVWLTATGLVIGLLMVVALVGFVFWQGLATFWPQPLVKLRLTDGVVVQGEVTRTEDFVPDPLSPITYIPLF